MFRENLDHIQKNLFGLFNAMPRALQKKAPASEEHEFYNLVFCNIDEQMFLSLYSDIGSRPNSIINGMVSALIWLHKRHWTYAELFNNMQLNLLTRLALTMSKVCHFVWQRCSTFKIVCYRIISKPAKT